MIRCKGLLNLYALTCLRLYIESYYSVLLRQNYLASTDVLIPFLELFRPTKMARGLNLSQLWRVRTKSIRNPKKTNTNIISFNQLLFGFFATLVNVMFCVNRKTK